MGNFFFNNWMEFFIVVLMVVGIVIAFISPSLFISYIVIFLSGMTGGRLLYERKGNPNLPYVIILLGFVIGFIIGSYGIYRANPIIILLLFFIGTKICMQLYKKEILHDTFF